MANLGNTGHRYKLSKLIGVEVEEGAVLCKMECGHDYRATPSYGTVETLARIIRQRIGKKRRCTGCDVEAQ